MVIKPFCIFGEFIDIEKIKLLQSKSLLMVDVSYFWLRYQKWTIDHGSALRWLLGSFFFKFKTYIVEIKLDVNWQTL